jgi:hypothetical protein
MPPAARLVALALFVGAAFAVGAVVAPHSVGELRATVDGAGVWAPVVFALCWIALTPALAPGTLLATAAGLAFGVGLGVTVGLVGATAGGILAFLIARGTAATAVAHFEGERLRRLQERAWSGAASWPWLRPGRLPAFRRRSGSVVCSNNRGVSRDSDTRRLQPARHADVRQQIHVSHNRGGAASCRA